MEETYKIWKKQQNLSVNIMILSSFENKWLRVHIPHTLAAAYYVHV